MNHVWEDAEAKRETVELRVKARPENLSLVRLALSGVATGAGAMPEIVADLKLAVTEACTNAIQHAYRGVGENDTIIVRYHVCTGSLSIEVEDAGIGFEPSVLAPTRNGNGAGLGLMIISELSDELTVTSGRSGSRVVFSKRFSPGG